jgi:hypothetical protein
VCKLLIDAMRQVPKDYLEQPFLDKTGGVNFAYLERVYAYELYHQLRLVIGNDKRMAVYGEPVKSSNALYYSSEKIPDLIIHEPGTSNNIAVIEIKSAWNLKKSGLIKDVKTATEFKKKDYICSVFIVFGNKKPAPTPKQVTILKVGFDIGLHHITKGTVNPL